MQFTRPKPTKLQNRAAAQVLHMSADLTLVPMNVLSDRGAPPLAATFWKANAAKSALALLRDGSESGGNRGWKCLMGLAASACIH